MKLLLDIETKEYYVYYEKGGDRALIRIDNLKPIMSTVIDMSIINIFKNRNDVIEEMEEFALQKLRNQEDGW